MVSLGRDSYHVEAVIDNSGSVRLYTLGEDETRVIDIPAKVLNGFIKVDDAVEAQAIAFAPEPQPGDAEGRSSAFVAELPNDFQGRTIEVTIPNVSIDGERFRLAFTNANASSAADSHTTSSHAPAGMPAKIMDKEERELYLEPGGQYTLADIESNGRTIPSQKFKGIPSAHDMNPKDGDRICPVTQTKANSKFTWIVGGKEYLFCCPPCVDEFLRAAKTSTNPLPDPETFVKKSDLP
jgi:YHS domain-containing protein